MCEEGSSSRKGWRSGHERRCESSKAFRCYSEWDEAPLNNVEEERERIRILERLLCLKCEEWFRESLNGLKEMI